MQTRRIIYMDDETWAQLGELAKVRKRSYSQALRDLVATATLAHEILPTGAVVAKRSPESLVETVDVALARQAKLLRTDEKQRAAERKKVHDVLSRIGKQ